MPILAGWLTGEQVPSEAIEQTITAMGNILARHGGIATRSVQPGAGLIVFADAAFAQPNNHEPSLLEWTPERRMMLYRRPLSGFHALYFIENWPAQGNLLFASEIQALLAVGAPRRLHLAALDALQRYGFIPAPWTAFKDISVVPAGSILRWQHAKTLLNTSADYRSDTNSSMPNSIEQLLQQGLQQILPVHDQLVAFTGADDASTIATLLAAKQTTTPFLISALGDTSHQEAWHTISLLADTAQRPLLAIQGVDQPEFWTAALAATESPCTTSYPLAWHQLLHTTAVESNARVAISGLGARPLVPCKNIMTISNLTVNEVSSDNTLSRYQKTLEHLEGYLPQPLWSAEASTQLSQLEKWENTLHARKLARKADQIPTAIQSHHYLDLHMRLPDLLVHPVQQLATQEHMVVRSPYLQISIMHSLYQLSLYQLSLLQESDTTKEDILVSLAHTLLPSKLQGIHNLPLLTPTRSLLDTSNSEIMQQTVSPEAIHTRGIFANEVLPYIQQQAKNGRKEAMRDLLFIFTTQLFCDLFDVTL